VRTILPADEDRSSAFALAWAAWRRYSVMLGSKRATWPASVKRRHRSYTVQVKNFVATPLVSIIIPTYRRSAYLAEALRSVFDQTCDDFEVIVVEDGSHDAADALAPFRDRVTYLWQPNQGQAAARNTGAARARGEWLAMLDDDDLWSPRKLERQLAESAGNAEVGLVHTDHMMLNSRGMHLANRELPRDQVPSGWVSKELFLSNFIVVSSTMIRRSVFERVGGFLPDREVAEDLDLWLRLSRACQILFVPEPLTIYRDHEDSLSTNPCWFRYHASVLERFVRSDSRIVAECGWAAIHRCIHDLYYRGGRTYFVREEPAEARRMFYRAWRWMPSDWRSLAYGTLCATGTYGRRFVRAVKRVLT
jgi:glycosyltransferase involved in cell wall biosynthesis